MSMADSRDRTSYWINNTVKNHLGENGCMLHRLSKKRNGLFVYQIIDQKGSVLAEMDRVRMEVEWSKDKLQSFINKKSSF